MTPWVTTAKRNRSKSQVRPMIFIAMREVMTSYLTTINILQTSFFTLKIWFRTQILPFWRILNMITLLRAPLSIKTRTLFLEIRWLRTPRGAMDLNTMKHSLHARTKNMTTLMNSKMLLKAQKIRSIDSVSQRGGKPMMSTYSKGLSSITFRIITQWSQTPQ